MRLCPPPSCARVCARRCPPPGPRPPHSTAPWPQRTPSRHSSSRQDQDPATHGSLKRMALRPGQGPSPSRHPARAAGGRTMATAEGLLGHWCRPRLLLQRTGPRRRPVHLGRSKSSGQGALLWPWGAGARGTGARGTQRVRRTAAWGRLVVSRRATLLGWVQGTQLQGWSALAAACGAAAARCGSLDRRPWQTGGRRARRCGMGGMGLWQQYWQSAL